MAIPSFTAEAVRKRLVRVGDPSLDALLFTTREDNPLTPHMFRRTVATVVNEQAGVDLAADLLDLVLAKGGGS